MKYSKKYKNLNIFLRFLLIGMFVLNFSFVGAQENAVPKEPSQQTKVGISVQPLFLLNNALKLDVEIHPHRKQAGIIGGVEIYKGKPAGLYQHIRNIFREDLDSEIKGFGINLAFVYQFNKDRTDDRSFYISPGITYRQLNLKVIGDGYYPYIENNLEYITYGEVAKNYRITPILVYGNVGFQRNLDPFLLDLYVGIGFKSIKKSQKFEELNDFNKAAYGYSYSGFLFQIGFKLGFQL